MSTDKIVFDRERFLRHFERVMKKALKTAGDKGMKLMKENIRSISGTGKSSWHNQVAAALQNKYEGFVDNVMTQLVGMVDVPDGSFLMIKAKLLEYGAGSAADTSGGCSGAPIAHHPGVAGLNDDISGYNDAFDAPYYELPESFNQGPQYWFQDASRLIDEIFEDEIQAAWDQINPWDFIHN